jgi:type IV secretion system protein VirD4
LITTTNIKRYVLPNLPYAFLFWLFGKGSEAVRTAPGGDTLQKIMYGIGNLNTTLAKPMPSFDPVDLLAGLIGTAAVFCFVLYKKHNAKKWRKDIEYGSARWRA